jgi:hypothetical protein
MSLAHTNSISWLEQMHFLSILSYQFISATQKALFQSLRHKEWFRNASVFKDLTTDKNNSSYHHYSLAKHVSNLIWLHSQSETSSIPPFPGYSLCRPAAMRNIAGLLGHIPHFIRNCRISQSACNMLHAHRPKTSWVICSSGVMLNFF